MEQSTKFNEYSACERAIKTIYGEREQFVIIGLTGRTGSGCSTISNILETEKFSDLKLRQPKSTEFQNAEERKYQIIYNYAQKHWNPFFRISMTDIIFSFVVQKNYDDFMKELEKIFDEDTAKKIQENISKKSSSIKEEFNYLNKIITNCIDQNGGLDRSDPNKLNTEYEILIKLSSIQSKFREAMQNISYFLEETNKVNAYTHCLQVIGNRIRHHGNVSEESEFTGEHMFALARRANDFIKAIRFLNKKSNQHTFICLDAIRNPYEATYFQDRYASFFLVAVSTDDEERKRRLAENYDSQQIRALDKTEYPGKPKKEYEMFTNQNIGACAQLADIYLYNPKENAQKYFITHQIIKYVTLIKHPGLVTPTNIERCMQIAYNAKLNSGCLSRQVGAVITDKYYSVKAIGWNSVAEGQVPCNLRSVNNYMDNKDEDTFSTYEIEDLEFCKHIESKYKVIAKNGLDVEQSLDGRLCTYCFKDEYGEMKHEKNQVHTRSLHAEENAFMQIVKYGGEGILGGNLFTSASSCVLCSKKAYQLGIKHIYYIDPYTDIANSHILSFGKDKSKCPKCHLFYGAIGKAYTYLFTQRISIKDELKCLISNYSK